MKASFERPACSGTPRPIRFRSRRKSLAMSSPRFARAAGDLGTKFLRPVRTGKASLPMLEELAPLLPSRIHPQSREREAYERMLFAEYTDATDNDRSRRKTLILAVRLIRHFEEDMNAEEMRWHLYAGHDGNGTKIPFDEPELEMQRRRWWAYHAGDLGRMAYEGLLKWLLDTLEIHQSGLTTTAFSASSRNFDLNGEARMARTKQSSPIIPPA